MCKEVSGDCGSEGTELRASVVPEEDAFFSEFLVSWMGKSLVLSSRVTEREILGVLRVVDAGVPVLVCMGVTGNRSRVGFIRQK